MPDDDVLEVVMLETVVLDAVVAESTGRATAARARRKLSFISSRTQYQNRGS